MANTAAASRGGTWGSLPALEVPRAPETLLLWSRALLLAAVVLGYFLLDQLTYVFLDLWLLQSLGVEEVFWTNFRVGLLLFLWGVAGPVLGIAVPAFLSPIHPAWRRIIVTVAVIAGLLGGYFLARQFLVFLQLSGGVEVGETDPVFGNDLGFYMFSLPALWVIWAAVFVPLVLGLISSALCTYLNDGSHGPEGDGRRRLTTGLGIISTPFALASLAAIGVLTAIGIWLARYDLLWKDNLDSSIYTGAQYLDVVGFFSYLSYYYLTAFVVLALTAAAVYALVQVRRAATRRQADNDQALARLRWVGYAAVALVALDFGFAAIVGLRGATVVSPNEPVIQLPYIKRHIDATLKGYGLDNVETVSFVPFGQNDPLPTAEELLQTATLKNAPLWPGWVSYLERVLDPQHSERVLLTGGDSMIYGPMLDMFRAQQKLRTYYDFLDIDTVRYQIDGEKRVFASSVRELPLRDPQPWIAWWGQRHLLYTHGHGLVMAEASGLAGDGEPVYVASGIPAQAVTPELLPQNPSIYYGEGPSYVMGFSNAENLQELDYPTEEGRADVVYPPSVHAGVAVDSFLKRLVIGWRSGVSFDIWFSGMISEGTRAHFYRTPIERVQRIAPFLYLDTNPYAVVHDDRIVWLVNAMTTSDRYPYSMLEDLGDKSTEQSFEPQPERRVNYVRDSVKAVVDAYTGDVRFYRIADEPVLNTWANVYPSLFTDGQEMPQNIRAHLQYPRHLMHIQFDDIYFRWHMTDPLTFYNIEDMWDDADEVKGPILDEGEAITFSIEPRNWMAETGDVLPASDDGPQFTLSMVFTNEQALNLRAIPLVYQDGADYGRIIVLQVPKGHFYYGPEQVDSAIDQDPDISEQISWWNRMGAEVIRGHTMTLVLGREVLYVEPLFIRSKQNPVSQLKRVVVVFRGFAADGITLEEGLQRAIDKAAAAQGRVVAQQRAAEVEQTPEMEQAPQTEQTPEMEQTPATEQTPE
jgi:uncharacterized protein